MVVEELTIEHLAENHDAIPEIISWLLAEWGHLTPGITPEKLESIFGERLVHRQIPETFVALIDGQVAGTASLISHDMTTRMELSPWLAAVYIKSEFRRKGIGSKLVQAVIDEATLLGLDRFYLFTPNQASFYARLGWQLLEETSYRGEQVAIMVYEIEQ